MPAFPPVTHSAQEIPMPKRKKTQARKPAPAKPPAKHQTKQAQLLALLRQSQGITIEQAAKALAWQPHSVRGIISGVLKKRLGLTITSAKGESGRVYRVAAGEAGKHS
jgi:Protein of unknown function (DUF3489)